MNKYRWHDLRKNPDDLPTNEEELVIVTYDNIRAYSMLRYCEGWNCRRTHDGEISREHEITGVIAWKSVEPFEEEDAKPEGFELEIADGGAVLSCRCSRCDSALSLFDCDKHERWLEAVAELMNYEEEMNNE